MNFYESLPEKNLNSPFVLVVKMNKYPDETQDIKKELQQDIPPVLVMVTDNVGLEKLSTTAYYNLSVNREKIHLQFTGKSQQEKQRKSVCAKENPDDVFFSEPTIKATSDGKRAIIIQILATNFFLSHLDDLYMKSI